MNRNYLAMVLAMLLVLAACSSDSDEPAASGSEDGSQTTTAPSGEGTDTTSLPSPSGGAGSATLTIGNETYAFDNYYCFQGSASTGNSRVSFSSGAMGEVDGTRVQLDASIQDTNEGDAMDGTGTIQSVSLNDIEDFENPGVAWEAVTGFIGDPAWVVEYDGSSVTADALFDNGLTDDIEEIPGTLDATCP